MPLGNPDFFQVAENGFGVPSSGGSIGVVGGTVAYTDTSEKTILRLPDNAVPVWVVVSVSTDFDGTTADLDVGLDTDADYFVAAASLLTQGDYASGDTGFVVGRLGVGVGKNASLVATFTGDSTAGEANILIFYYLAGDGIVVLD